MLDELDFQILYELDKNGRQTFSEIAKRLGKKTSVITYRLKKLQERGILLGYLAIFNTAKLGSQVFDLYLRVVNHDDASEKRIVKFLEKNPHVNSIERIIGKYQIYVSVFAKDSRIVEELLKSVAQEFGNSLRSYKLLLVYDAYAPAHNYLFQNWRKIKHENSLLQADTVPLTKKELAVLSVVNKNPRASYHELAESLHMSNATAKSLYTGLEKKGVILYIRPSLNAVKMGFMHKLINIKLRYNNLLKVAEMKEYLLKLRQTMFLSLTMGTYDLTGELVFTNLDDFRNFQNTFFRKFGEYIRFADYYDYYEEVKYHHMPLVEGKN